MLTRGTTYEAIRDAFRWRIPDRYNIGVDCCDRWADGTGRPALLHLHADGRLDRISFDALNDGPPALADHARRQRMQPGLWQLVALRDEADRRRLLDAFGILVLPAPRGEFEHNAALHLVDAQARLMRIVGLGEPETALTGALSLAGP